jgi:hypothetical protein
MIDENHKERETPQYVYAWIALCRRFAGRLCVSSFNFHELLTVLDDAIVPDGHQKSRRRAVPAAIFLM